MLSSFRTWLVNHSSAILATAIAVSKAGLLGKVAMAIGAALSTVFVGIQAS